MENGGPFRYIEGRKLRDFTDGTSHTIIVSEVVAGRDDEYHHLNSSDYDILGTWAMAFLSSSYLPPIRVLRTAQAGVAITGNRSRPAEKGVRLTSTVVSMWLPEVSIQMV